MLLSSAAASQAQDFDLNAEIEEGDEEKLIGELKLPGFVEWKSDYIAHVRRSRHARQRGQDEL